MNDNPELETDMTDTTTQDLRDRIEEGEARNAARAEPLPLDTSSGDKPVATNDDEAGFTAKVTAKTSSAADKFTAFAKEHPVATVAGGVVLGLAVASLFKGPRRAAAAGGAKAAGLATLAGELALAYGAQVLDSAQDAGRQGARKLDDMSDSVGDTARKVRRDAAYRAQVTAEAARIARRDTGKRITRALGRK